jgi:RNA polymerase sigma factor (sigma-70 family)
MATSPMTEVMHHIRKTVLLGDDLGLTDGQLLTDFISRGDEAAFAALVRRHGPMVWGVCRRLLRNTHDAEDAFQATFLVLVRKAASIASRQLVANWLHGVAHVTAMKARATAARRKNRETQVREMPEPAVLEKDLSWDLQPLLDEELNRLPDKYRAVIILCDLEGMTRKETARQLGCPEGTVAGHLARARVMLAKRLTQRHVALSGGALAALLSQQTTKAALPTSLVSSTIKAAGSFAGAQWAAKEVISARIAALAEGVLKTMFLSKLKAAAGACLIIGLILMLGSAFAYRTLAADNESTSKEQGKLRDTLLVLDQQFWEASAKHDTETLSKLIADDYLGIGTNQSWTKKTLLQQHRDFRTGNLQLLTNRDVTRLHEHAALLTYEAKFKVFTRGGALSDTAHQRLIACWVERGGGWFVVFSQVTDVVQPPGHAPALKAPSNAGQEKGEWFDEQKEAEKWGQAILLPFKPAVTIKPAVNNKPGIKNFILPMNDGGSLAFRCCLLPRHHLPRIGFRSNGSDQDRIQNAWDDDYPLVIVGANEKDWPKFADLQKGITLSPPLFVDRASEITVDGVLRSVKHNADNTIKLELTIATVATVESLAIDGVLRAKEVKVVIDGRPAKLMDLKAAMPISMRIAKVTQQEAAVEIRAGKRLESLQPSNR